MRKITEIIVHCTATRERLDIGAAEIDRYHRQRGFDSIGYHYVVRLDGSIEKGRDESAVGAHCLSHNVCSIGVAYVGGLDADGKPKDTRTPAQKRSLSALLTELRRRYPGAKIHGHRDFAAKACPCFDATKEYVAL
ncbi:MAG: N-acetylmuramoyl-L-alanine amidase [Muribaculaceae bacterium]